MHILHLTPYYRPAYVFGGVVRAVEGLARALKKRGHRVTILTTDAVDHGSRYTGEMDEYVDGIRIVRAANLFLKTRARFNLSSPVNIRRLAGPLLQDVDALHCHEFRTIENLQVVPLAGKRGIPVVLSPHGTMSYRAGRSRLKIVWDHLFSPIIAQHIAEAVALTSQEYEDIRFLWSHIRKSNVSVRLSIISNGVDLLEFDHLPDAKNFRAKYGLGEMPVILFVGRLQARKGIDVLARAFRQIEAQDVRLLIVGPDEGMMDMIRGIADERVILTGYLDGQERLAAYAASDFLVLPAIGEGLSMAALEAMAAGLPVVLSPGCYMPEAEEKGAGIIVEPEADALAKALTDLLANRELREQMGFAARHLARAQYSWDAVAEKYEDLYQSLKSY